MIKKTLSLVGRTFRYFFNGIILSVIVPLGLLFVPWYLFDAFTNAKPLGLEDLAFIGGLGWALPFTLMLFFFLLFRREHREEYLRATRGEGFFEYFWYNHGPIAMHLLVSRIAWDTTGRYSSGIQAYARLCWLLNWVWIPILLALVVVAVFEIGQ